MHEHFIFLTLKLILWQKKMMAHFVFQFGRVKTCLLTLLCRGEMQATVIGLKRNSATVYKIQIYEHCGSRMTLVSLSILASEH